MFTKELLYVEIVRNKLQIILQRRTIHLQNVILFS